MIEVSSCLFYDCALGKSKKGKLQDPKDLFDIAGALKQRKPLRKTTTALALEGKLINHYQDWIVHEYQ